MSSDDPCPCGSGKLFKLCCGLYIGGKKHPPTAEALMRSRYTAYARCDIDYLYKTSSAQVRKEFDAESSRKWAESSTWNGLEVLRTEQGGEQEQTGLVEFVAHYTVNESTFNHHECAEFARDELGEWVFVDGKIIGPEPVRREEPKIGRNDPCPCGSGKKYKKCCA